MMMPRKLARAMTAIRKGLLTLRYCGLPFTLRRVAHQVYSRTVFLNLTKSLDYPISQGTFPCVVTRATPEDIDELLQEARRGSKQARYDVLWHCWFYQRGFHNCYITRTRDTNEICNIRFLITRQDIEDLGLQGEYPKLAADEVMPENVYTLERFRRMGVQTASYYQLIQICRQLGFKRTTGHIAADNTAAIAQNMGRGNRVYARVLERQVLFRTTRKIIERFDPPVPIDHVVAVPGPKATSPPE